MNPGCVAIAISAASPDRIRAGNAIRGPEYRLDPHVPDRLAAVALVLGQGAAEPSVEGGDGGVEDAAGGVEVAGPQGVGIARQSGPGEGQRLGGQAQGGGTWCGSIGS